jgi:hypothetical protein
LEVDAVVDGLGTTKNEALIVVVEGNEETILDHGLPNIGSAPTNSTASGLGLGLV